MKPETIIVSEISKECKGKACMFSLMNGIQINQFTEAENRILVTRR
jgi:hypothetical protein